MRRLAPFAAILMALAVSLPVAAAGGHTQSFTYTFHGTQTVIGTNPCTGGDWTLTETSNIVQHVTSFIDVARSIETLTEEDGFTAVDAATGVTYAGHSTFHATQTMNPQNATSTLLATTRATGSDGSAILYHVVSHFTLLPDGNIAVSFDRATATCG